MTYKFKSTERSFGKGNEFETRALLFLIGKSDSKNDIHYVFIDCFNDVSGADAICASISSIQSKSTSNMTPRVIGKSLITLFDNFTSEIHFSSYMLFMPKPKPQYLLDADSFVFGIGNFGDRKADVRDGLIGEYARKNEIIDEPNNPELAADYIEDFLGRVIFVVDGYTKAEYVKCLTKFGNKELKTDEFYAAIFDEVGKIQIAKKMTTIEGKEIIEAKDALHFEKHLFTRDIKTLVVNRIIGVDVFRKAAIPINFIGMTRALDSEEIKDLIQECNTKLSKALFDKNSKREFWSFLEAAIIKAYSKPSLSAYEVYTEIESEIGVNSRYMNGIAGVYLVALVKEGIES